MRVDAHVDDHVVHTIRYAPRSYSVSAGECVVRIDDITNDVPKAKTEAAREFHRRTGGIPPLRSLVAQTAERVHFTEHYDPREEAMKAMKR